MERTSQDVAQENFLTGKMSEKKFLGKITVVLWQQKTYEEGEKRKEKL